jgi:(4S)-4-hydroxy-5-phosphonooxypentane-2,3-dione isomerase
MYVITVKFQVVEQYVNDFLTAMHKQAQDSLTLEKNCHYFDVCQNTTDGSIIFLYEIYQSEADFKDHLTSQHFLSFSKQVAPWVVSKTVESFTRSVSSTPDK